MLNSIVDIAGINRISRQILNEAAAAIAGMTKFRVSAEADDKPIEYQTLDEVRDEIRRRQRIAVYFAVRCQRQFIQQQISRNRKRTKHDYQ